jgi:flagellar protein FliJ
VKRFAFKLERILTLRKYRERERELELARATGECVRIRRDIETATREKALELSSRFVRPGDPATLHSSWLFVSRLEQRIIRNEASLRAAERRRSELQLVYLEARRERMVLDKLKERRGEAYIAAKKLEEISEIDDMNTGRFGGRIGG